MTAALTIELVTGCIGGEIHGCDFRQPISAEVAVELRHALLRHKVLFCRQQFLSIADQKQLTGVFGGLSQMPYIEPLADEPEVIAVLKEASEVNRGVFGGDWHSDFSFLKIPPAGSVLNAVQVPAVGGDTLWANQITALERLPEALQQKIIGRRAIHTGKHYGKAHAPSLKSRSSAAIKMTRGDPTADHETFHPLIRQHPESGQRALFVNPIYTTRIEGFTAEDSAPLLTQLYHHATRLDICCRWRWQAGDVVIWDNRATLHYAVNDYDGYRRLLYRTTFSDHRAPY